MPMPGEENQRFRERLGELDELIPTLQKERNRLREKLASIKYPVLTLPYDVTAQIFLWCLPAGYGTWEQRGDSNWYSEYRGRQH